MNTLVTTAAHLFAPWQAAYSDSTVISTSVTTVHVVAIVFGAGLAIAADRATLRHARGDDGERLRLLGEIHATHRPVLIALALMFVSGAALAAADIKTFVGAPVFWIKLGLVTLLLMNGVVLERTEASLKKGNSLEVLSGIGAERCGSDFGDPRCSASHYGQRQSWPAQRWSTHRDWSGNGHDL
jgi:hypothetical protein